MLSSRSLDHTRPRISNHGAWQRLQQFYPVVTNSRTCSTAFHLARRELFIWRGRMSGLILAAGQDQRIIGGNINV